MVLRAVAIVVARRRGNGTEAEVSFAGLDLLPLNTPGEAGRTYKAARLVLKSGTKGSLRALILTCAAAWVAMFAVLVVGLIEIFRG
jgi:small neutral amino acid transporter SnatA (MarC family)